MRIGIDIDGVLTDVRKFTIELSKITKMICMDWGI